MITLIRNMIKRPTPPTGANSANLLIQTFNSVIRPHGEWARRNFDSHDPVMGFGEEIGELAHAILKLKQGIRGSLSTHYAAISDALADATLFLAHVCYLARVEKLPGEIAFALDENTSVERAISALFRRASSLMDMEGHFDAVVVSAHAKAILAFLNAIASQYGINYPLALADTAREVWKRDWRRYPLTGKPQLPGVPVLTDTTPLPVSSIQFIAPDIGLMLSAAFQRGYDLGSSNQVSPEDAEIIFNREFGTAVVSRPFEPKPKPGEAISVDGSGGFERIGKAQSQNDDRSQIGGGPRA